MSDPHVDNLLAIQNRQADDADADLLAELTADNTSTRRGAGTNRRTISYTDEHGVGHNLEVVD